MRISDLRSDVCSSDLGECSCGRKKGLRDRRPRIDEEYRRQRQAHEYSKSPVEPLRCTERKRVDAETEDHNNGERSEYYDPLQGAALGEELPSKRGLATGGEQQRHDSGKQDPCRNRKSAGKGKRVTVRVDLGGHVIIKKKE